MCLVWGRDILYVFFLKLSFFWSTVYWISIPCDYCRCVLKFLCMLGFIWGACFTIPLISLLGPHQFHTLIFATASRPDFSLPLFIAWYFTHTFFLASLNHFFLPNELRIFFVRFSFKFYEFWQKWLLPKMPLTSL